MAASLGFRHHLVSQFGRPRGPLGRLAGFVLAHRPSNRERNRWTIELLGIRPGDQVLELGFGPGLSIEHASRLAHEGRVVGVDHSETMVAIASKRNRSAIAQSRVRLVAGAFSDLDRLEVAGPFDKIFAVNALQFSDDAEGLARDLARRLRAGGTLAITFQSRRAGATSEDSKRGGDELVRLLEAAGLADLRVEVLPLEPVCAVCVLGRKPGADAR